MAETPSSRCARVGCTNTLPPKGKRGPARTYCSPACKAAAFRNRRAAREWLPAIAASELHVPESAPADEQVARAVLETSALAATYRRLAEEARPQLAHRCERMYIALRADLDEIFDGADR